LSSFSGLAQRDIKVLNGYKYIYLAPLTYQDGTSDKWGIRNSVRERLIATGIKVIETTIPPSDVQNNTCLIVTCTIGHTNNGYQATSDYVYLNLLNCNDKSIFQSQGATGALVMTIQSGWRKATKEALKDISSFKYNFDESLSVESEMLKNLPDVEKTNETEETLKRYLEENTIEPLEGIYKSYQSDGMPYYKFGIKKFGDKFKVIIIESDNKLWKAGEVKAYFEQSSMSGFYSVKWYMGDKKAYETFGSMENVALLKVELKDNSTGEKKQDKFIKMYPAASKSGSIKTESAKASGSGFFISTDGILATNAHVVEGVKSITVSIANEVGIFSYKAKTLLIDNRNDVAILKIDDEKFKGFSSLPFGIIEKADIGEKVFTIGYPLSDIMGSNFKVNDGIISSKSGIADDIRYYQISVPLQPGNSGGPLFNKEGNIIGITSARLNSKAVGTEIENVNYALKSSYLLNLYNMLPSPSKINASSTISVMEFKDQIKVLKNYVCLIVVN